MDFKEQGGATSSCAPMLSGTMALIHSEYPNLKPDELRAAVRMSARNDLVGLPGVFHHPATGSGLLQVDSAIQSAPGAKIHPWYLIEKTTPSNIAQLGKEPERRFKQ